ncbi:dTMP kinase [Planctomycetales bacterium ZRK34]|nr:dTMP kinase [Planctomycetales bacterium ZRK34]
MTTDTAWTRHLAGVFIVFDGPDGSGKSTQFRRFSRFVQTAGLGVEEVREPGGTAVGEYIRNVLLDPEIERDHHMAVRCEMMLYMASRAQLVEERIRPALSAGKCVLADRFVSSTLAYQGTAGGMSIDAIRQVADVAIGKDWPALTVVFDVDEQTAAHRLNPLLDRMELKGAEYHRKVRQGYLDQAAADPDHYLVIDARPDANTVFTALCEGVQKHFID